MLKKLLFTMVFTLVGLVGLNAQTFPCGVQNLTSCNCPGEGFLVADSTPCASNSGEAQIFLLVDAVDATITTDPDTNGIVATSLTGNFTAPTGDYVMYSLVYNTANAAQIFPSIGLGTNIAALQSLGMMTAAGVWTGTNPAFTLIASGLATVNGPECNCDGTGPGNPTGPGPGGSTGSVSGTLTYVGGGAVDGVTVAIYDTNQNLLGTAVTDASGGYTFPGLPDGNYQVVVGSDPDGGTLSSIGYLNTTITGGGAASGNNFQYNMGTTTGPTGPGTCSSTIDATANIDCLSNSTYTVILTLGGPLASGGFNITRPDGSVVATGAQNGYTDTNIYTLAQYPSYTYTITSISDPACFVTIGPISALPCQGPTPVEVIEFDGTEAGKANYLHWSTGSEFNNDYFSLLRSEDGVNFELVTKINSQGNSTSTQNYEFYDYDFRSSVSYYRLVQADLNGQGTAVGDVIVIERKDISFDISNVYPVPSSDMVNIDFLNDKDGAVNVNIYDVTGRIIEKFDVDTNSGFNTLQLSIGHYAIGTYFITLATDNQTVTAKFIKD